MSAEIIGKDAQVCVAGCGRMGRPMLAALLAAGFDATGFDIRPASDFGDLAPRMAADPAAPPPGTSVLVTVVRDIAQTEAALFDAQKLLARLPGLTHLVISSTLSPRWLRGLAARVSPAIRLVDAPMSGAAIAAEERRLSFMLGGRDADLDYLMPLFEAMGGSFHRMGGFGAGMSAKVLNNLLAGAGTAMTRLVLDWGDRLGLDEARLLALIHQSSGQNWLASGFEEIEFARHGFSPGNTLGILKKDLESALDVAPEGADTRLPRAVIAEIAGLAPRTGARSGARRKP